MNDRDYLAMALAQKEGYRCTNRSSKEGRHTSRTFGVRSEEHSRIYMELAEKDQDESSSEDSGEESGEVATAVADDLQRQTTAEEDNDESDADAADAAKIGKLISHHLCFASTNNKTRLFIFLDIFQMQNGKRFSVFVIFCLIPLGICFGRASKFSLSSSFSIWYMSWV